MSASMPSDCISASVRRPRGAETALGLAVRGARVGVVEEVGEAHDPVAGVEEDLEVVGVAFHRVGALDREYRAHHAGVFASRFPQSAQILAAAYHHETSCGFGGEGLERLGDQQCALLRRTAPQARPQQIARPIEQVQGIRGGALHVHAERYHGGGREDLQADAAFAQARQVDVPDIATRREIAPEEQRVGMVIDHER
ncbi:MAG: hypothetical protein VCB99_10580 [Myxococcota bacterium]